MPSLSSTRISPATVSLVQRSPFPLNSPTLSRRSPLNPGRPTLHHLHRRARASIRAQPSAPLSTRAPPSNPHRLARRGPTSRPSRGFVLWRFSYAGPKCVARSVIGRRPKTIYEVSLVKSFCGGQERSSLLSFQSGVPSGRFLHSGRDSPFCLAAPSSQAPTPAGLRHQAQGLDGASACRAIIGHRTDNI
jgi:hypothetical protein